MRIHITDTETKVTEIGFSMDGGSEFIRQAEDPDMIRIYDDDEDFAIIYKTDIPNLILALQKAQEIWPLN